MRPSVVILTFNSSDSIPATLTSVKAITDDIHIVDSGSTDQTIAIAQAAGAAVSHHPFENYGAQRNWAIDNLETRYKWQLHLDADERLTPSSSRRSPHSPKIPISLVTSSRACFNSWAAFFTMAA